LLKKKEEESMKSKRYSEEQIIRIIREKEGGTPGKELCRRYGMSEPTLYKWLKKYGGMEVNDAMRLKTLEKENTQLKKLVADLSLDKRVLEDLLRKNF
jgi:putative transposase